MSIRSGIPALLSGLLLLFAAGSAQAEVYYVAPTGDDTALGSEQSPWRTIAKAAAALQPGDTARILAGTYIGERMPPELDCPEGTPDCSLPAIKPRNSGQNGSPIVFEAWPPGAPVIIDQLGAYHGFFIAQDRHYIELRGLEIRNARTAGIRTDDNVSDLLIENCVIHSVSGDDNMGGIYLEDCRNSTIRGCDIYDVGASGFFNAAAIITFNSANNIIEFCRLHDATHGVYVKQAADPGRDLTIRANRIFDTVKGVFLSIRGVGDPAHQDEQIYGNLFYDIVESAIESDTLQAASDSAGLYIGNNTFARVGNAIDLDRFHDIWITQNIFYPLASAGAEYGFALVTRFDPGLIGAMEMDWDFFDPAARFELHRYSAAQQTFTTLDAWRAYGFDPNSISGDPLYIAAATDNFHIRRASACRNGGWSLFPSRFGETDIDGEERIIDGLVDIGADEADLVLRPDTNCDGFINFFDIDPFLLAVFDPAAYSAAFPACPLNSADLNIDGQVNFFDIDPFVGCLFGEGCP